MSKGTPRDITSKVIPRDTKGHYVKSTTNDFLVKDTLLGLNLPLLNTRSKVGKWV